MFKLQRPTNKQSKSRDILDFKFSHFQALHVPKGWDKLFVSIISVETGKTIAKLGKALVKNGSCQWTETLSESICISRDDSSSKGNDECLVKLLVSTGSTRSSILGEAIINVASYTSSRASAAVSQTLKKCTYGTVLQVKIQCLNPRSRTGDEGTRYSSSREKDLNVDHHDKGRKSSFSDNSSDRTVVLRNQDSDSVSHPSKLDSKETSLSGSVSVQSFDSLEGSVGRVSVSERNPLNNNEYNSYHGIQPGSSSDSNQILDNYSDDNNCPSNQSSVKSRVYSREDSQNEIVVNLSSVSFSRNLLEAAEYSIDELRAEAKMWERNARKLMFDLDMSRKEFSDVSKKHKDLEMELTASHTEQDGMKQEVEQLKQELEKSSMDREDPAVQSESLIQIQKELEDELKYEKKLSADLSQQLRQSQESNIELVSFLQELEETVEQQRIEIEDLSSLKLDYKDLEDSIGRISDENRTLLIQLQQVQESEKKLQGDVKFLEEALRNKTDELMNRWKSEVSVKDEDIANLVAKVWSTNDDNDDESNVDLVKEVESLRLKFQELEKDCTELTDENLELLVKLKGSDKSEVIRKSASFDSTSSHSEISDPTFQICSSEDELKKIESSEKLTEILRHHEDEIKERDVIIADANRKMEEHERYKAKIQEEFAELMEELDRKRSEVDLIESKLLLKEQEADFLVQRRDELEAEIKLCLQEIENFKSVAMSLQDENEKLKVEMDIQILDLKRKSDDVERQWIGAREQCEYLEADNKTLQASAESFAQENAELKSEIKELHGYCSEMEAQLRQCEQDLSDCNQKVEVLENRVTSLLEDFALKGKSVESEVQALVREHNHQNEKLSLEVENLSRQISDSDKEREQISLDSSGEVSRLLAEAMLESELKIQDLTGQIAASKRKSSTLMADHERILKSLANYRTNEEKLKTCINDLELKLTISDYEREELTKEVSILKTQLRNAAGVHEEILILISELEGCRLEKGKLEVSFLTVSEDYEKLKADNILLTEKISGFEGCKREKLALQEKLVKIENELSVKEILCNQKRDIENELLEIKRANIQLQQKMYILEEERDEYLKKVRELEENLRVIEKRVNNTPKEVHGPYDRDESPLAVSVDNVSRNESIENESGSTSAVQRKKPGGNGTEVVARERYERTKSSLETELRDLRERYLEMSLKYAEVEGEREDLVMRLRETRGIKRWFS